MFETLLLDFLARTYRDAAHSIFSPSGSAMWLNCSGSLIPNLLAFDEAGFEAAEGTVAHELGETWLKTDERPDERVGEIVTIQEGRQTFDIEITKSMLDYVEEYVDWCINMPGEQYVEQKVYFSRLTPIPKQGGTADFFACSKHKLNITDLKYGSGVQVYAENNTQAMLYALGVFYKYDHLYDFQEFTIRIAQPRRDHMDEWETDRKTLLAFARRVKERSALAWRLNAPLSPSESACRWCKVKTHCPAYLKVADDIAKDCFADLDDEITSESVQPVLDELSIGLFDPQLTTPTLLGTADMSRVLPFRSMFENWFARIETELEQRAMDGERVPGRKLVEARSNRVFPSQDKAEARLREGGVDFFDLYSLKFTTPAQAVELLRAKAGMKKKDAEQFILPVVHKPHGKPTLVPESDRRPEYTPPADDVFNDLDDDI